jgi:hypothetical protein
LQRLCDFDLEKSISIAMFDSLVVQGVHKSFLAPFSTPMLRQLVGVGAKLDSPPTAAGIAQVIADAKERLVHISYHASKQIEEICAAKKLAHRQHTKIAERQHRLHQRQEAEREGLLELEERRRRLWPANAETPDKSRKQFRRKASMERIEREVREVLWFGVVMLTVGTCAAHCANPAGCSCCSRTCSLRFSRCCSHSWDYTACISIQ